MGKTEANKYDLVCAAWTGAKTWERNCGYLWWAPDALYIPSAGVVTFDGVEPEVSLVAVEHLMVCSWQLSLNTCAHSDSLFLYPTS